jgi:hypothetical protein
MLAGPWTPWLARLRHDLVKRLVWPARDRRDLGGEPAPGELVARLVDAEGRDVTAPALWRLLRAEAPDPHARALDDFEAAVEAAVEAAGAGRLGPVLALEAAFEALARAAGDR